MKAKARNNEERKRGKRDEKEEGRGERNRGREGERDLETIAMSNKVNQSYVNDMPKCFIFMQKQITVKYPQHKH